MAKSRRDFYSRPAHERLGIKVTEGLISLAVVHFLSPYLLDVLTPLQAQINAHAAAAGQPVSNVGTAAVANQLLTPVPGSVS